jgi:uncharacterized protein YkwD
MARIVAALGAALSLAHLPVAGLSASASAQSAPTVARVLELTNQERARAGLAPLALNPQLTQAAQSYSQVLASDACFDHTCGPVPDMAQRDAQVGYTGWSTLGENIAAGYPSAEAVVAGWMASPGHRENILNPQYTEIGIGNVSGTGKYGSYWTEEFGARGGDAVGMSFEDDSQ